MKLYQMINYNYDRRPLPDPVVVARTAKEAGEIFWQNASGVVVEDDGFDDSACATMDDGEIYIWIQKVNHENDILIF